MKKEVCRRGYHVIHGMLRGIHTVGESHTMQMNNKSKGNLSEDKS